MRLDQPDTDPWFLDEPRAHSGAPVGEGQFQRLCFDGCRCSVTRVQGVQQVFAAAVPRGGATVEAQASDALRMLEMLFDEVGARRSIVRQGVFVADESLIEPCRRLIHEFYGEDLPATTYVPQRPAGGQLVALQAWGVGQGEPRVVIQRLSEQLVTVSCDGVRWVHCSGLRPRCRSTRVYERAQSGFQVLREQLALAGLELDQVLRTWLYLGDIVGEEGDTQRYKELNRARTDAYEGVDFLKTSLLIPRESQVFPASTGIGTQGRELRFGCIAFHTGRTDVHAVPLENPRQTSAFDYATKYSPKSPKFSRGMALARGDDATIFVSGTASITRSETRHTGDAGAQAAETLDNIEALISADNLSRHGLHGFGATAASNLAVARIYVKRLEDIRRVRAVCEERLGGVPLIFTQADVCRPELLVEIEGIALARRP